jgi:hypothetical protein
MKITVHATYEIDIPEPESIEGIELMSNMDLIAEGDRNPATGDITTLVAFYMLCEHHKGYEDRIELLDVTA